MLETEIEKMQKKLTWKDITGFKKEPWLTKNAILGYGASNNKDTYKAASYFNDASKFAKNANETMQPISHYDETFAQLAKTAYEYSILLKELDRKARANEKLQNLPIDQIFNTLKQLTFLS